MKAILTFTLGVALHLVVAAQCQLGETREEYIQCVSPWMTFPPRTETCPVSVLPPWYIHQVELGVRSLGGTGGQMVVTPDGIVAKERRQSMARFITSRISESVESSDFEKTNRLAGLLQGVVSESLPGVNADKLIVRVSLFSTSGGFLPCAPGVTTSHCPHVRVPPVSYRLICLPTQ